MSNLENPDSQHYGVGELMQSIKKGLQRAGKDIDNLQSNDLAPMDAFHTRGRESTAELASMFRMTPAHEVLDVGCGIGGSVRFVAEQFGCTVTGVDLTTQYVETARELSERVGLTDHVRFVHGSALELPFNDDDFDVVWTEHAQMNIADKTRFYGEIARVLKPQGTFLFHDIFAGQGPLRFPVPWADENSFSHLATPEQARLVMKQCGLTVTNWVDKHSQSLGFFRQALENINSNGLPPIGIHLLMGDNAIEKLSNLVDNLASGSITVGLGAATRKK